MNSTVDFVDSIPQDTATAAQEAVKDLFPFKFKNRYKSEYETLEAWLGCKSINAINQTVLLGYFNEKVSVLAFYSGIINFFFRSKL